MKKILLTLLITICLTSCSSGGRVSLDKGDKMMETDKWTKVDTNNAVEEILDQMYTHNGYINYKNSLGRKPKIFIKDVTNATADPYFRVDELNNALLKELSRSGNFVIVNRKNSDSLNDELSYQRGGTVKEQDIASAINETGADTLIFGEITMQPVRTGNQVVNEYTVNMTLTNLETKEEIARMDFSATKYRKEGFIGW